MSGSDQDEGPVRCLFVAGFPLNTFEREIYNFFRWFDNFEDVGIVTKQHKVEAFVQFHDKESAEAALTILEKNVSFDIFSGQSLRVQWSRHNMRRRSGPRERRPRMWDIQESKHQMSPSNRQHQQQPQSSVYTQVPQQQVQSTQFYPHQQAVTQNQFVQPQQQQPAFADPYNQFGGGAQKRRRSDGVGPNGECDTLFLRNLEQGTTQDQISTLFQQEQGFVRLNLREVRGAPCAWVQFRDVQCAIQVRDKLTSGQPLPFLQGADVIWARNSTITPNSERGA